MWDFETRVVARTFQAHSSAVTCVAWARNGHYLMSGSQDKVVCLWDILQNKKVGHCQSLVLSLEAQVTFYGRIEHFTPGLQR